MPTVTDIVSASIVPVFGTVWWFARTMWVEEERVPYMNWYLKADSTQNVAYLSNDTEIPCANTELLYVRGVTEPAPLGYLLGPKLKREVTGQLGEDVVVVGLSYPATIELSTPRQGVEAFIGHVKLQAQKCPDTSFAFAGYSTGADVLHTALNQLEEVKERVQAITVFGDPYASIGFPPYYTGRTLSLCNPGDRACGGSGLLKHYYYGGNDTEFAEIAGRFIAKKVRQGPGSTGGSGPATLEKLPPTGSGAWIWAVWQSWPPKAWKKEFPGGVKAPSVGLKGTKVANVDFGEL